MPGPGLFFYSPMLHQYSFDPAGMWSSTMRRWQVFFAVTLVDGADDHAAAVDAHHFAWWQVGDGDQGLSNKFLWFVVFVDAGEDGSVFAGSVVEGELEELFALWHGFAIEDFDGAEVALTEGVEVDHVLEEGFDLYACEIDGFRLFRRWRFGFLFLLCACIVQWLHGWEQQHVADRFGIGEEHDHAVDANARGRRLVAGRIRGR